MRKILSIILLAMSMLPLCVQAEESKDTVYIDFNPHIGRLENYIEQAGIVSLYVIDEEYYPTEDGLDCDGHQMSIAYKCDKLYTKITPDMDIDAGSFLMDCHTMDVITIGNFNGEVKEVNGRTVYDFSCDGSDGKVYVIHVECYRPEVKEEIDVTLTNASFDDFGNRFVMAGGWDDYYLILQCNLQGQSYEGTYNFMNNAGAANSMLLCHSPEAMLMMLEFEYTVTARKDGYYDVHGHFLLEKGTLVNFYVTNAPESDGIGNITDNQSNCGKVRKVLRNGRVNILRNGRQYGVDGRVSLY